MTQQPHELDIVDILESWSSRDDVPVELQQYLSIARDEIAGLREENKHLRKIVDDEAPRF